jgi:hypothetical protein
MSSAEESRKQIVGVLVAFGGLIIVGISYPLAKTDFTRGCAAFFALLLAIIATALVSAWATDNNTHDEYATDSYHFLQEPNWKSNALAWHPVLMVSMFFFGQVVAVLSWSLISDHRVAKVVHVLSQSVALMGLALGLSAIENYKNFQYKQPSLVSMHAWIGISNVSIFCFNYCFGLFMATLTQFWPDSRLRTSWKLRDIHMRFGIISLALTTTSICTGIVNQFGETACYYVYPDGKQFSGADPNPASNYPKLPTACKIANGLGIVVLCSAMFTLFSVILRSFSVENYSHAPVAMKEPELASQSTNSPTNANSSAKPPPQYEMVTRTFAHQTVQL